VGAHVLQAEAIPVVKNKYLLRLIRFKVFFKKREKPMEKEVETASKVVNPELSGGLHSYKETVYNILENFFGWLSTHQAIAIIIILIVLGIMIWLLLRAKKYRIQFKNEVYLKKKEIVKKDALIEEQENKLTNLQKKMSDQQGVVSEALLRTIRTITGYDADQLPIFFKSLTQISGNPLQIADQQAITTPESQQLDGESGDSTETTDSKEKFDSDDDVLDNNDTKEEITLGDESSEDSDAKEKLASGDDSLEKNETTERLVSDGDYLEKDIAKEEIASDNDSSEENSVKKVKLTSDDDPEEASDTKKAGEG